MARKSSKSSNSNDAGLQRVGIDIGYGYVKVAADNHEPIAFPSIIGHAIPLDFQASEITARYPGDQLTDEYGDWFVGRLAQSQLREGEQLKLRGRGASIEEEFAFRRRLALAAIGKLYAGDASGDAVHIRLATGLPVRHMGDAADFKKSLIGQHPIKTDSANFVANITEVSVMPQPYGSIYSASMKDSGEQDECYIYERTGVIDVGTYTVDVTLDDVGEYIAALSNSNESGVHSVHERIANQYERDYREKPTVAQVEEIMRTGCFRYRGDIVNYTDVLNEAIRPLEDSVLNLLQNTWKTAGNIDVIYVTGGGASLVFDAIKSVYGQAVLIDEAQFANARGYLRYARSLDVE